jgi:hypothetical protein
VTNAKLTTQAQALGEIREMILLGVEAGGERDGYVRLEALDAKLKLAGQRPITDTAATRTACAPSRPPCASTRAPSWRGLRDA